jgi:aspartokinase
VCSARSNNTKLEGTTNRLLRAARAAERPKTRGYDEIIHAIRLDHIQTGEQTIQSKEILAQYIENVNEELNKLVRILESVQHLEEITARAEDLVVGKGERLSCLYMSALLNDRGIPAQYVDASNIMKWNAPAQGLGESFYKNLAAALATEVDACGDRVPVITGFFGEDVRARQCKLGRINAHRQRSGRYIEYHRPRIHRFVCCAGCRRYPGLRASSLEGGRRNLYSRPEEGSYSEAVAICHTLRSC